MTPTTDSVPGPSTDLPATAGPGPEALVAAAWRRYHEAAAGLMREIEASEQFRTVPEQRPKAYHAMMESLAMAYNFAVGPRLRRPRIHHNTAWQTDMYTLGGNGPDILRRIVIPHAAPGITAGCIVVFMLTLGNYLTPTLLGGKDSLWFTEQIYTQFITRFNWEQGAAFGFLLLALSTAIVWAGLRLAGQRFGEVMRRT